MVAVINTGHAVRSIFNYNENKVSIGAASCIGEGNYPLDIDQMDAAFKLNFLLKQLELNENVTRNSVHISLNFDPSETHLSKEKLMDIANIYMEKIGFGGQPYLVYQHHDAGHPHIHIVSIKVKSDGRRIDMQNIGRNQSETARREIETAFNLVRAQSKNKSAEIKPEAVNIQKIRYAASDSKKEINRILNAIIPAYKFTTIGELNAILNLYNVTADTGKAGSRMFLHKGLVYQILDEQKKPIGVPIKASSFYSKPTLQNLEKRFLSNKAARMPQMKKLRSFIDLAFLKSNKITLNDLQQKLLKDGIAMVFRINEQGLLYGITYVDHATKCIFNGSALGSSYSAAGIQQRCEVREVKVTPQGENLSNSMNQTGLASTPKGSSGFISAYELQQIIDAVLQPEFTPDYIPNHLKGKRRKKKRKGQSDN